MDIIHLTSDVLRGRISVGRTTERSLQSSAIKENAKETFLEVQAAYEGERVGLKSKGQKMLMGFGWKSCRIRS